MSRVTGFDEVYAESRERLLLQLYAYCGDVDVADDALTEAFITASRHWHRLNTLAGIDSWLRERAIRRIDGRPRILRDAAAGATPGPTMRGSATRVSAKPRAENARLLASLKALDPVSRRLMIVRRLDDADLPSTAREVGLTDAAAEQALARATTTLHAAGIDTTPAGLQAQLAGLGEDLAGREAPPVKGVRRAGARRRLAMTTALSVALVAVLAGAGLVTASQPFASVPGSARPHTPSTSPPTSTPPAVHLGATDLLKAERVAGADPAGGWRALPPPTRPVGLSVYGGCVLAADNPPPETSWIRDFAPRGRQRSPEGIPLREVLLLAPTTAEAQRAFRQVTFGFTGCAGHQLGSYQTVGSLGDRARLVSLRFPTPGGPVLQTVAVVKSGPVVIVLAAMSAPGTNSELGPPMLAALAGAALNRACATSASACAAPPYPITNLSPPSDGTPDGLLSVVDLPLIPGITAPWAGSTPAQDGHNPASTACDRADFSRGGAAPVTSRSFVVPDSPKLPPLFGLSETVGVFRSEAAATLFVTSIRQSVTSCHRRHPTLSVQSTTSYTSHLSRGTIWRLKQQVSPRLTALFRVALVRVGARVAEVTLTPVPGYDVSPTDYLALAKRAAVRLAG